MLDALKKLEAAATPGPWTREKPGHDENGWPMGVAIGGMPGRQTIYASPPGGSYPSADCDLTVAARNSLPALIAVAEAAERVCQLNLSGPMMAMDVMMEVSALRAALAKLEEQA